MRFYHGLTSIYPGSFGPHSEVKKLAAQQRSQAQRATASFSNAATYGRTFDTPGASYAREVLASSYDRREQERAAAKIDGLAFDRNPRKIKEEHLQEQARLAAVQKEIEEDARERAWTVRKS